MAKSMSLEQATQFGEAWNSRDPDRVASFFAEDGSFHASVGSEHLGATFSGDMAKTKNAFRKVRG